MSISISFGGGKFRSRTSREYLIHYPPGHPSYGRSRIEWTSPSYGSLPIDTVDAENVSGTGAFTLVSTARTGAQKYYPSGSAPARGPQPSPKPKFRPLDLEDTT